MSLSQEDAIALAERLGLSTWGMSSQESVSHAHSRIIAAIIEASTAVPREPTEAMVSAARKYTFGAQGEQLRNVWRAMYDAAQGAMPSPAAPLLEPKPCGCPRNDAWRCAVELALDSVACPCECHKRSTAAPLPTPAAPLGAEDAALIATLRDGQQDFGRARDRDNNPDECALRDVGYNFGPLLGPAADRIEALSAQVAAGEADRRDAEYGRILMRYIDRLTDYDESDPVDKVIYELSAAVNDEIIRQRGLASCSR